MGMEWSPALVPVQRDPTAFRADWTFRSTGQKTPGQCLGGRCQDLPQNLAPTLKTSSPSVLLPRRGFAHLWP